MTKRRRRKLRRKLRKAAAEAAGRSEISDLKSENQTRSASPAATIERPGADVGPRIDTELTTRAFQLRVETVDEQARTVEAVIATETPVQVLDWDRWEVIDEVLRMDGVRLPPGGQVPLLDSHFRYSTEQIKGSTRNIRAEGVNLIGRNHFSEAAEDEWRKVREGHLTDNSVGYRVLAHTDIEPGESATVKGRKYTAGARRLRITTDWQLRENSLVAIGADELAKHREAARKPPADSDSTRGLRGNEREPIMDFTQWLKARGLDPDKLDDARRTELRAEFDKLCAATEPAERAEPEKTAPADPPDSDDNRGEPDEPAAPADITGAVRDALAAERKEERERVASIRAEGEGIGQTIVDRAIAEGDSIDQFRGKALTALREGRGVSVGTPAIHIHDSSVTRETLADGLLMRSGITPGDERAAERAERVSDMALIDVCRAGCIAAGVQPPHNRHELIQRAFSTLDVSTIFTNVANKSLLNGFAETPNTCLQWCDTVEEPNFKTATRVRAKTSGGLKPVNAHGEIEDTKVIDWAETYSLLTYAEGLTFTRQQILDDDAGALTRMPRNMGADALRKVDDLFYAHLMANGAMNDSVALFHADHANLNTTAPLNSDNLSAAKAAMRKQTDIDDETPLNIEPRFLIVPPELEHTALELVNSSLIVYGADDESVRGNINVHHKTLKVIVDPRLSNANYTNYSVEDWYLAGSPTQGDTMVVAYLRGTGRRPTLEQISLDRHVVGIGWRVFIDLAAKALDFRGLQKNDAS